MDKALKIGLILSATDKMSRVVDEAIGKSEKKMTAFQKKMEKTGKGFQKFGKIMTGTGALIAAGIFKDVESIGEKAKQIQFNSPKIGLSTEQYQKLTYAASRSSLATELFENSIAKLSKTQQMAASGGKAAMLAFKAAGISSVTANGGLKSSSVLLMELADNFHKAKDGAAKTAVAQLIFGRSGKEMIPLLNKGSKAIKALGDEYEHKAFLTDNDLRNYGKYRAAMAENKIAMLGLSTAIATAIVPMFVKYADKTSKIADKMLIWVKRNKSLTQSIVKWVAIGGAALSGMGAFLITFGTVTRSISLGIKAFNALKFSIFAVRYASIVLNGALIGASIKAFNALKFSIFAAKYGLFLFKNSAVFLATKTFILASAQKVAAVATWLWNAALAASPIVWIAAGVVALGAAVYLCWKKFDWFRAGVKTTWDTIKGFGIILKNYVVDRIKSIISGLGSMGAAIANLFKGNFKEAVNDAKLGIISLSGVEARVNAAVATKNLVTSIPQRYNEKLSLERINKDVSKTENISRSMQTLNSKSNNSNSRIVYSPTINIQNATDADKDSFKKMLDKHKEDLRRIMENNVKNNNRLSFQ